ncbi:hypothetical protein [Rhizobium mesoamericanum]|uniref:Uncharacterized protein n=1 Tax=Rhizobium mesoamericanum STM3625 TaxID=1211777 RepID=K0PL21_9HYPH|nr:hypothetical protein [Rhizobium mesoamericanum]CCM77136.1 hypothetical protein BN77_4187 [Rhizobium mesoamericanum STM3625]
MPSFLLGPLGKLAGVVLIVLAAFLGFRLWLASHDTAILSGYVLLSEKTAAEAKAAEIERQRDAASQALDEHRKRLAAAEASQQAAKDTLESEIKAYELQLSEKNRACLADAADRDFILHH